MEHSLAIQTQTIHINGNRLPHHENAHLATGDLIVRYDPHLLFPRELEIS